MKDSGPFREGMVHVRRKRCATCIFFPGNRMRLKPGRVKQMKRDADKEGTCITCHEDMDTPKAAVCAGYYATHNSQLLQIAERMGRVTLD